MPTHADQRRRAARAARKGAVARVRRRQLRLARRARRAHPRLPRRSAAAIAAAAGRAARRGADPRRRRARARRHDHLLRRRAVRRARHLRRGAGRRAPPVARRHAGAAARRHPRLSRSGRRRAHRRLGRASRCSWSSAAWAGGARSSPSPRSTLPVILFASGSSYAVHVLGRYYLLRARALGRRRDPRVAAHRRAAAGHRRRHHRGRLLLASSPPTCGRCARSASPAARACSSAGSRRSRWSRRWSRCFRARRSSEVQLDRIGDALVAHVALGAAPPPRCSSSARSALGALTVGPMLRVRVRMEPQRLLPRRLRAVAGRALPRSSTSAARTFAQVWLDGRLRRSVDAARARAPRGLRALACPGVTQVQSVLHAADAGDQRHGRRPALPWKRSAGGRTCTSSSRGEPGMRQLITPERHDALLQVRMRGDAHAGARRARAASRATGCAASRARPPSTTSPSACRGRRARHGRIGLAARSADDAATARRARRRSTKSGRAGAPRSSTDYLRAKRRRRCPTPRAPSSRASPSPTPDGSPQLEAAIAKAAPSPEEGELAYQFLDDAPRRGASPHRRRARRCR